MNWTPRRERFRAILAGGRCVHPGSVFDPISARIAETLGFEIGMFAGSTASLTVLGAPDLIVLTLSEFAAQAYRICRAGDLPLLVDADHGYGNALNVRRTVEELETAGVAALTIEDTLLPRPFGDGRVQLISIEEGIGKMHAALAARQDPGLVIAGRTSALTITGTDDAVARARAYEAAGVDALFFTGVKMRAQLDAIAAAVRIPIFLGGVDGEVSDPAYLSALGGRRQRRLLCPVQHRQGRGDIDGEDLAVPHHLLAVDEDIADGAIGCRVDQAAQGIVDRPHVGMRHVDE